MVPSAEQAALGACDPQHRWYKQVLGQLLLHGDYHNFTLVVPRPSSGQNPHTPLLTYSRIPKAIPPHHVVIRVDRFGFSSNNITYQALGEEPHFRYFDFHPAPQSPDVHGVIPVWGFGSVIASSVSAIHVNERVFGYMAMARYLLLPVDASDINKFSFYVPRPHLPPDRRPYNQFTRCARDKLYHPAQEDLSMLYRPLFWTSFWAEDWLFAALTTQKQKPYHGATTILISSASAKTAFCLAYCVQKRRSRYGHQDQDASVKVKVVGLTSKGNLAFTKGLGLYDEVFTYDGVEAGLGACVGPGEGRNDDDDSRTWIYVDVAGNDALNTRVWNILGSRIVRNVSLGVTNLTPAVQSTYVMPVSGVTNTPGAVSKPVSNPVSADISVEFFFMPEWLAARRRTLTASRIAEMQYTAWTALMRDCLGWDEGALERAEPGVAVEDRKPWVTIKRSWGLEEVPREYGQVVNGGVGPEKGMVWSLWGEREGLGSDREVLWRGSGEAQGKL